MFLWKARVHLGQNGYAPAQKAYKKFLALRGTITLIMGTNLSDFRDTNFRLSPKMRIKGEGGTISLRS